jgi:arylsulfatase
MIANWQGRIEPGTVNPHVSAFYDVFSTLCEIAAVPPPEQTDGISFAPTLLGRDGQREHEFLYWEFPSYRGQQAVRMGDWKGLRRDIFSDHLKIQLYDLKRDPEERYDLADEHPGIVAKLEQIMSREHVASSLDRFKIPQLGDH